MQKRRCLYAMDERLNFLFLTEAEAVQAGAGNMPRCIEVMEEVFRSEERRVGKEC